MENKEELELALKWFEEEGVPSYEEDGNIYVAVVGDWQIQISSSEVSYRAGLQREFAN